MPSPAPSSVTPRKKRITSSRYGKVAVKYTTWKHRDNAMEYSSRNFCNKQSRCRTHRACSAQAKDPGVQPHAYAGPKMCLTHKREKCQSCVHGWQISLILLWTPKHKKESWKLTKLCLFMLGFCDLESEKLFQDFFRNLFGGTSCRKSTGPNNHMAGKRIPPGLGAFHLDKIIT